MLVKLQASGCSGQRGWLFYKLAKLWQDLVHAPLCYIYSVWVDYTGLVPLALLLWFVWVNYTGLVPLALLSWCVWVNYTGLVPLALLLWCVWVNYTGLVPLAQGRSCADYILPSLCEFYPYLLPNRTSQIAYLKRKRKLPYCLKHKK